MDRLCAAESGDGGEARTGEEKGGKNATTTTDGGECSSVDARDGAPTAALPPPGATSTSVPATEAEVSSASLRHRRQEGESMEDFVKKTCVWCARSRGGDREVLEFLVRSRGIWLHALQYSFAVPGGERLCYRTELPEWATIGSS